MNDREHIDMFILQFSNVFDVINHCFICAKLAALRLSPLVVGWIYRYFTNCTFHVCI